MQKIAAITMQKVAAKTAAVVVFILCGCQLYLTQGQDCLRNTPTFRDQGAGKNVTRNNNFYIIPAYNFSCHGKVTQWGVFVNQEGHGDRYTIQFTVFRPSNGPNCYSWISVNNFVDVTPSDGRITLDVPVIEQTSVQPGDVVGVLPRSSNIEIGIESDITISTITAWYTPTDMLRVNISECAYQTAPDGNLPLSTVIAPVITAVVDPFPSPSATDSPLSSHFLSSSSSLPPSSLLLTPPAPLSSHPVLSTPAIAGITVGAVVCVGILVTLVLSMIIAVEKKRFLQMKTKASVSVSGSHEATDSSISMSTCRAYTAVKLQSFKTSGSETSPVPAIAIPTKENIAYSGTDDIADESLLHEVPVKITYENLLYEEAVNITDESVLYEEPVNITDESLQYDYPRD